MIGRIRAKEKARRWMSRNALIADTETTGFAKHDEVVEVAVVNSLGMAVFHEFVKPTVPMCRSIPLRCAFTEYPKDSLRDAAAGMACMTSSAA